MTVFTIEIFYNNTLVNKKLTILVEIVIKLQEIPIAIISIAKRSKVIQCNISGNCCVYNKIQFIKETVALVFNNFNGVPILK